MALKIGSFNLCNFSSKTKGRKFPKDFDAVAEAILKSGADVVALQEVIDQNAIGNLLDKLRGFGGANRDWRAFFDKKQTWRNNQEGYAFVWDEKCVTFAKDDDGSEVLPELVTKFTSIKRPPMVARFVTTGSAELHYELCIINTHIIFRPDKYQAHHPELYGGTAMRAFEYAKIANNVYPHFSNKLCTYTIIAGDYNLVSSMLDKVNARPKLSEGQPTMMSVQSDKTTVRTIELMAGNKLEPDVSSSGSMSFFSEIYNGVMRLFKKNESLDQLPSLLVDKQAQRENVEARQPTVDGAYVNDYDHFSFEVGRVGDYVRNAHRINAPELLFPMSSRMFHSYKEKVSDHVPIVATLDLSASQSL